MAIKQKAAAPAVMKLVDGSPDTLWTSTSNDADIQVLTMDQVFKPRIVACATGPQKRGKTHLGLDFPPPILYIGVEKGGLEGPGQQFSDKIKRGDISTASLDWERPIGGDKGSQKVIKSASLAQEKFERLMENGIRNYRTIIGDTYTDLWQLFRIAEFGKLGEVMPHHYAPVNMAFKEHIGRVLATNVNLLMIHRTKNEYKDNKKTGRAIRDGHNGAEYDAQVCLWMDRDYGANDQNPAWPSGPFYYQVYDCRANAALVGQTFVQPANGFLDLAMAMYPDSDPGVWL